MMIVIHHRCSDYASYRAARVKSLFNVERGCNFDLEASLPIEGSDWKVGCIVGPSGSGKTSLGRRVFGTDRLHNLHARWPADAPIIDAIAPAGNFDGWSAASLPA